MPPFLCIIYELFATGFTLVIGNPAVAQSVGIVVSFISVFVQTVQTLVPLAIMSFGMSCKVTFIEESFATVWVDAEEAGVALVGKHTCLYLALECKGMVTFRAFMILVLMFVFMS